MAIGSLMRGRASRIKICVRGKVCQKSIQCLRIRHHFIMASPQMRILHVVTKACRGIKKAEPRHAKHLVTCSRDKRAWVEESPESYASDMYLVRKMLGSS